MPQPEEGAPQTWYTCRNNRWSDDFTIAPVEILKATDKTVTVADQYRPGRTTRYQRESSDFGYYPTRAEAEARVRERATERLRYHRDGAAKAEAALRGLGVAQEGGGNG